MGRTLLPADLQPGEVALFHFLGKKRMMCAADGTVESPTAVKFPHTSEAETYAQKYVADHPARGCRIHDAEGTCVAEIRGAQSPAAGYTRAQAKRDLWIGIAGFIVIPFGYLFDRWVGWGLFLGMALATKCVMLGIVKLSDGIAGLMDSKHR